jgi:uncharacterized protein (DUF486 family)
MRTVLLLLCSNVFMTFAWYGNLNNPHVQAMPLWKAILISWGIAFFEYCFMVPANRYGHLQFTTAQLKIIQEVITLVVFGFFSVFYLGESFRWNYGMAFLCILLAVYFMFRK